MIRCNRRRRNAKNERGQTIVEYILVMSLVVGLLVGVMSYLKKSEFIFKNFTAPMLSYLRFNYKYGDPSALGWDEIGGPRKHIQISKPSSGRTFRLFKPANR